MFGVVRKDILLLVAVLVSALGAAGAAQAPRLRASSVTCGEQPPGASVAAYRPCTFTNLYLWGGKAYFVVEDGEAAPDLTRLGLRFEVWAKKEGPDAVLSFMQTIQAADLAALLAAAAGDRAGGGGAGRAAAAAAAVGAAPGGGGPGGSGQRAAAVQQETVPLGYLWKARHVSPSEHLGACDRLGSGRTGKSNYGHFTAEWLPPLYMTLCENFGHCTYANRSALRIFDVLTGRGCNCLDNYPPYFQEHVECLAGAPLRHISGGALRGRLVLLQTAWTGLGPRCRGIPGGCYKGDGSRLPPTAPLLARWRGLMAQCFHAPQLELPAPLAPAQLLLVDRLYTSGRHLLNVNSIQRALKAHFPADVVHVRLEYMEGLSVPQQAALWGASTVVIHMHGAALGNYFYLPKHAVTVQLAALPQGQWRYNPAIYTERLQSDLAGVSDVTAMDWANNATAHAHLNTEHVAAMFQRKPHLRAFIKNRAAYGEFLATFRCPSRGLSKDLRAACASLLLNLNLVMDPTEAVAVAEGALRLAFEQQGRPYPLGSPLEGGAKGRKDDGVGSGSGGEGRGGSGHGSSSGGSSGSSARAGGTTAARAGSGGGGSGGARLEPRQAAQQPCPLHQLQAQGGAQLLLLGMALGCLAPLGLHAAGRLIRRRRK